MNRDSRHWLFWERLVPWAVLGFLLVYTYGEIFYAPYIGFNFIPSTGEITAVFVENPLGLNLQEGDLLWQVDSITWAEYRADIRQPLFANIEAGQVLSLVVERDSETLTIPWLVHGPTTWDILDRLMNLWWLAYIFWLGGTATVLLVRPKDTRWLLLVVFYFLTALWLIAGNTSRWHMWESATVVRVAVWLSVPIYLHLHWMFPIPLGRLPASIWWSGYLASMALAGLQWFQRLPSRAYNWGFLIAIIGSLVLLVAHFIRQPNERHLIRLLLIALGLAVMPAIAINIAQLLQAPPWFGYAALLALPLIPGAYFYTTYRYRLGGLELRTNRLIAIYVFLILLGSVVAILISLATFLFEFPGEVIFLGLGATLLVTVVTGLWFTPFQRFVEHRLLGIPLPPTYLLEIYAARITTSLDSRRLVHVLRDEVLPSLLIRQSTLVRLHNDNLLDPVYLEGVESEQLPIPSEMPILLAEAGNYRVPSLVDDSPHACRWARLALPLRIGDQVIGLWLLGRRDPDDFYAQSEIATFQALADQTAVALTNINQAEQLQAVYQANIDRHEVERTSLAHVLHDEVLHQLAILSMQVEEIRASPQFDEAYQALTRRIRQIITGLRPAMMIYGLHAALEELAEDLNDRAGNATNVQLDLPKSQGRYPERIEQCLFRIVQQACENALRHAHASMICIDGRLESQYAHIVVTDDGIGFAVDKQVDLTHLLANRHFGLVGMYERAAIIGAELHIDSTPDQGTQVTVAWRADSDLFK